MSSPVTPRLRGLTALAALGLVAGLATGRPELVVMATPFALLVAIGLALTTEPNISAELTLERSRVLEGDGVRAALALRNDGAGAVIVDLRVPASRHLTVDPLDPTLVSLARGGSLQLPLVLRAERWGAHAFGPVVARVSDPRGIATWDRTLGRRLVLRAFPREQRLRELVAPLHMQPFLGTHVSRAHGDGIEFADVRPFVPGDRVRHVNWKATARRGSLYVTERHPEQSSDVVLLLDTFAEAREASAGTLDAAVRACASLARAHLARRDRVALVDFGGTLHWLEPAFGVNQLYRIVDALLASEIAFSYAWRAVTSIPSRVLPSRAHVLAVTPLLDERSIKLIVDLRTRGRDVTVVEISPHAMTAPGGLAGDVLAYRLWRLQPEALRARLQALGVGVAVWEPDGELAPALEGVNSFRRSLTRIALA